MMLASADHDRVIGYPPHILCLPQNPSKPIQQILLREYKTGVQDSCQVPP